MEQDRKPKNKFKHTCVKICCISNGIILIEGKLVITRKMPHPFTYTFNQGIPLLGDLSPDTLAKT